MGMQNVISTLPPKLLREVNIMHMVYTSSHLIGIQYAVNLSMDTSRPDSS